MYSNTSCEDATIPSPRPVPRCDHGEEAHVKQSRHPTTVLVLIIVVLIRL
jgi:hypothetical protein